jgi:hypothetical protein
VRRRNTQDRTVEPVDERSLGVTQSRRGLDNGIQHRLDVVRGTANHVEHVARGGLVFERLLQLARACLHFVE